MLKKELVLYDRDEKGKLIPKEVELFLTKKDKEEHPDLIGETISMIPMTRGEMKKLFGIIGKEGETVNLDSDEDGEIIEKYCVNPTFAKDEIPYIKPVLSRTIVRTIFENSGIKIDEKGAKSMKENDEFGKNS